MDQTETVCIVTTSHQGVFVGTLVRYDQPAKLAHMRNFRMVLHFGTTEGLLQLCNGPTASTRLSAPCQYGRIEAVTAVFSTEPGAW